MKRQTTIDKEKKVLAAFHRMLRSGKDYSTDYMYKEAGAPCFLSARGAAEIVRAYYRGRISVHMEHYVDQNASRTHKVLVREFSALYDVCERESRLIIRYIKA